MRALFDHLLVNLYLKNAKKILLGPKSVSDVRKTCSKMLKFAHSKNSIGLIFFFRFRFGIIFMLVKFKSGRLFSG